MSTKWQKGKSGNPGGRPRIPDDLKKSCRRLAMRGMKVLEDIINSRDEWVDGRRVAIGATPSEKTAAIKLALEYGYGKPVQPIAGEGEGDAGVVVHVLTLTSPDEGKPDGQG